jgi:peptidase E
MSRLFLCSEASSVLEQLADLANIIPSETYVAFIPNAAEPYSDDLLSLTWVSNEFNIWKELGYKVIWVDLNSETDLHKFKTTKFQVIHINGGSPVYLLLLLRKLGLIDYIKNEVLNNNVIFSGSSAGSMIAGYDISCERYADFDLYPENIDLIPQLNDDYKCLNLIELNLLPHFNSIDSVSQNIKVISNPKQGQKPLLFLSDNQFIWFKDGMFKVVSI